MANVGDGIRTPKEIASIFGLLAVISMGALYTRRSVRLGALWLFLIWCYATVCLNTFYFPVWLPNNIVVNTSVDLFAWKELFYITLACLAIYTIASADKPKIKSLKTSIISVRFGEPKNIRVIAVAISWVVAVMAVYAIIQAIGLDNVFRASNYADLLATTNTDPHFHYTHRTVGTVGNPTLLGVFIAICVPFTLYIRSKLGYVAFGLSVVLLIILQSAGALIGGAVGITAYLALRHGLVRNILFGAFIGSLIFGTVLIVYPECRASEATKEIAQGSFTSYLNPTGRVEVHKIAWEFLRQRPLIGLGLGSFDYMIGRNPQVIERMKGEAWRELHDDIGQIWFTTGLVGLSLFVWLCVSAIKGVFRNPSNDAMVLVSALSAFLVMSLVLFPMRTQPSAFYGVILLGLLFRVTGGKR